MNSSFNPHFKKIFIILQKGILLIALQSCSGHEKSEKERLRDQNAKGEYIYRYHHEAQYPEVSSQHREREPYPWETSAQ